MVNQITKEKVNACCATSIGKKIRIARTEAGLTQTELGKMVGRCKQLISEIERGNINLSYEMAVQIADICDKPLDFFAT